MLTVVSVSQLVTEMELTGVSLGPDGLEPDVRIAKVAWEIKWRCPLCGRVATDISGTRMEMGSTRACLCERVPRAIPNNDSIRASTRPDGLVEGRTLRPDMLDDIKRKV